MAKDKVGKLAVEVDASAERLGGNLQKAGQTIKQFSHQARKDLGDVDGDFLDKLAAKAKDIKKEGRQKGESALESFLGGGASGAVDFGLNALGLGMQGLVVEGVGKAFASGAENLSKLVTGEMDPSTAINQWATGLPIIGEFVSGWKSILELTTGEAQEAQELNRILKEQELTSRSIAQLNKVGAQGRAMFGDLGSVEANRLAQHAGLVGEKERLRPTDADVKTELGPWMSLVTQMNIGMAQMTGSKSLEEQAYAVYSAAEKRVEERRKPASDALDLAGGQVDQQAKVMLQRARHSIGVGLVGDASKVLRGFQDFPGGNTADAQKIQKLMSAYSQGWAMQDAFKDRMNDGNASPDQKKAAELGLAAARHWTDLATGSKNLDLEPYIPMRFAGAEMASGAYGGAAEYSREKDQSDYAKSADFVSAQKETTAAVNKLNDLISQALNMGTPLFSDGGS